MESRHLRKGGYLASFLRSAGVVLFVAAGLVFLSGCRMEQAARPQPLPIDPVEECCGVRVERIALTAAGYMLDLRFRVLDEEKAAGLFGSGVENYLVHQDSGARLIVPTPPKVGAMRQNQDRPRKDRTYFVMFANPGRLVKAGDRVNVVVGDLHVEDLLVQ